MDRGLNYAFEHRWFHQGIRAKEAIASNFVPTINKSRYSFDGKVLTAVVSIQ